MNNLDEMTKELSRYLARHEKFKTIFKTFQDNIVHLKSRSFPVRGITIDNDSDINTSILFVGRKYNIRFSSCMTNEGLKGKISIYRATETAEVIEVSSVTYNGQSVVDIEPPSGEDPIALNEDSCCINLVLNWLYNDINA